MHEARFVCILPMLIVLSVNACSDTRRAASDAATDDTQFSILQPYHPERFSCSECRIVADVPVDVGEGIYGPNRLGGVLKRDRSGRYWISRTFEEGVVGVYDSAGQFITGIGKLGDGPGELRFISSLAEGETGMYLADFQTNRLNVYDDSLHLNRTHPLNFGFHAFDFLPDGNIVAWFSVPYGPTPAAVHLLSDSGRYIAPIVPESRFANETQQMLMGDHVIAAAPNGDLLVGNAANYAIQILRGREVVGQLASPVDWFESYADYSVDGPPVRIARMMSIDVDEMNRAWIVFHVPDPSYAGGRYKIDPDKMKPMSQMNAEYNSAIEVWDLNTGKLLTGIMVGPLLQGLADSRHAYGFIEDESGEVRARVWRLSFHQSTKARE